MPSLPLLGSCGCSCSPPTCDGKTLVAIIPSQATADGTGSFCPGTFNCSPPGCVTTCGAVDNIVNWLISQWTAFQDDTTYPWDTVTTALFTDSTSTAPYSTTQTSSYPSLFANFGSGYVNNGLFAAQGVAPAGSTCAYAQLTAMNMTASLYVNPLNIPENPEPCLMTPSGPYYIPMPPLDYCATETEGDTPLTSYAIAYQLNQTGGSGDCLPPLPGGTAYTTYCQTPDPFFGDDPP